jgi:hypothetical protein
MYVKRWNKRPHEYDSQLSGKSISATILFLLALYICLTWKSHSFKFLGHRASDGFEFPRGHTGGRQTLYASLATVNIMFESSSAQAASYLPSHVGSHPMSASEARECLLLLLCLRCGNRQYLYLQHFVSPAL